MAETILDKIVADKKDEVEQLKKSVPLSALKKRIAMSPPSLDFTSALRAEGISLIAEVKKASPIKGLLHPDLDPVKVARIYEENGAAAISVLTDVDHFQGSLDYLAAIRKTAKIPLLRKDFIFDEYQVYESAAFGADALLLIAAILEQKQLEELLELSHKLGLDCLFEVHDEEELTMALLAGADIIGINNRNLKTFKKDINTTRRLRLHIPPETIVVSESGIKNAEDMKKLKECKVDAILVGEALVTARDIPAKIRELLS